MKERPILFSAPMVRALLDGSKTQTRRVIKPLPQMVTCHSIAEWDGDPAVLMRLLEQSGKTCPYGKPGDRLWVREAWRASSAHDDIAPRDIPVGDEIHYRATPSGSMLLGKGRPSIFMPRWASRITLEVTAVRLERLQDISETDAVAEGCVTEEIVSGYDGKIIKVPAEVPHAGGGTVGWDNAADWFADLWESINGDGSWDANPLVWVVEFKRLKPPGNLAR